MVGWGAQQGKRSSSSSSLFTRRCSPCSSSSSSGRSSNGNSPCSSSSSECNSSTGAARQPQRMQTAGRHLRPAQASGHAPLEAAHFKHIAPQLALAALPKLVQPPSELAVQLAGLEACSSRAAAGAGGGGGTQWAAAAAAMQGQQAGRCTQVTWHLHALPACQHASTL